jgi:hypothetical protein
MRDLAEELRSGDSKLRCLDAALALLDEAELYLTGSNGAYVWRFHQRIEHIRSIYNINK